MKSNVPDLIVCYARHAVRMLPELLLEEYDKSGEIQRKRYRLFQLRTEIYFGDFYDHFYEATKAEIRRMARLN